MTARDTAAAPEVGSLPLVPRNPLPLWKLVQLVRRLDTGQEVIRDAGGPITRIQLGPKKLMPPIVAVMSPAGMRDVLGRNDASSDRCIIHEQVQEMAGDSLWVLPNEQWRPRKRALAPVFTKTSVRAFGGHMSKAAQGFVDRWPSGGEVDLDAECRRVAMQSLGRSVLGVDLNERGETIARCMHVASSYTADRALRPVRAPRWLSTPARRRARRAVDAMRVITDEMVKACRSDPTRDAPLVQALIAATDPETGRPLTDEEISNDLLIFMLAGHDTTATALTHALWVLGHHPDIQDRVAAEAAAIGDRELTPDDVPALGYTVQVLHESVRLCPPAAGVARLVTRDFAVDGYRVEAGSLVALGLYALHHDPALWPDPMAFDPDRFSPENVKARDRWQFLPFLGGGRPCIGEHFARLETTLALATVVRACRIESLDDLFECEVPLTTVAKGPIRARVTPRR
ncbi:MULTISPECIES: cytochrome P450 [Mycolicibacterium]|jgi:cytochrome P450|uniref:cytochrome P450 n=1 Tax=Mycolicibacterium TaxID=1866885 RepID=UPI00298BDC0C|nr:cytochrome P450 [Mycolicibacterium sp. D5.8-2]MDW5614169.1 cytochrome P450 [Mycolicibacterium sp. D5.8-2]